MTGYAESRSFINIAGHRLEALTIGDVTSSAPTLVFLHAGLGSLDLWKEYPSKLVERTGFGALVYSRYGYGRSDSLSEKRSVNYLHHEGQEVLPEILDAFEISRPILIGHSDGATIALLFAAAFPSRPCAIILEAPHIFVEDITLAGLREAKEAYENGPLRNALQPHHIDAETTFRGWNDIWLNPEFRDWNIEAELKTIACPVLLIQGEDDQYGTMAQLEGIRRQVPGAELHMIQQCRHSPHQDQPDIVLEHMVRFIKDLGVSSEYQE